MSEGRRVGSPNDWRAPSLGRFAWMLVDPANPLRECGSNSCPVDGAEVEAACQFGHANWQALAVILPNLIDWCGDSYASFDAVARLQDKLTALLAFARVTRTVSDGVFAEFDRADIPYAALKASALQALAEGDEFARIGKDIDVAVSDEDLSRAQETACACGFIAAQWDPERQRFHPADPWLRAEVEKQHYELGFLARRQVVKGLSPDEDAAIRRGLSDQYLWQQTEKGDLACYTCIDIHHGISLDIDCEAMVAGRQPAPGHPDRFVPALEWLLLHVVFKIYWEGAHIYNKGGYQYADLAMLLQHCDDVSFLRFVELIETHRLLAPAHFVLRRLETDLYLRLPHVVDEFLTMTAWVPDRRNAVSENDLGDMWPKLWGRR